MTVCVQSMLYFYHRIIMDLESAKKTLLLLQIASLQIELQPRNVYQNDQKIQLYDFMSVTNY